MSSSVDSRTLFIDEPARRVAVVLVEHAGRTVSSAVRTATVSIVNRVPGPLARCFRSGGLLARAAAPLLERLLPKELTEVVVRSGPASGLRLKIDPLREKFYWTGTHEQPVQTALVESLHPGDIVWDVGAHIGFFAILSARLVGASGLVVAFEPARGNRGRLNESLELNKIENVVVRREAVAASNGTAVLHPRGSSLMWTLRQGHGSAMSTAVDCVTLDEVSTELHAPTLIKIDAEDAELDVLRGARDLIRERRPTIVIELGHSSPIRDCLALLEGYAAQPLDGVHWVLKPVRAASDQRRAADRIPERPGFPSIVARERDNG
jgi:FkbM family methyltransferase